MMELMFFVGGDNDLISSLYKVLCDSYSLVAFDCLTNSLHHPHYTLNNNCANFKTNALKSTLNNWY